MSRTNRFLSKYAALIAQSFKKVKYAPAGIKTILTGMPIRKTIAEVREIPFPALGKEDKFQIMVLGGSQGAKIFGDVVPEVIKKLSPARRKKSAFSNNAAKPTSKTSKPPMTVAAQK